MLGAACAGEVVAMEIGYLLLESSAIVEKLDILCWESCCGHEKIRA